MAITYTLIASSTVGSGGASSISFSSIPNTYTDLKLVVSSRTTQVLTYSPLALLINSSSSSLSDKVIEGYNGTVSAYSNSPGTIYGYANGANSTASTFSSVEYYFPNAFGSTNKAFSVESATEGNTTGLPMDMYSALWSNTSAISSITINATNSSTFVQYSSAYLYGISKS